MVKRYSYWWESPPDFALQGQIPARADAVIIGAGMAGISTAYWLSQLTKKYKKPFRIVVVDEAPHAAFKSSGRMTGSVYLGSNRSINSLVELLDADSVKQLFAYGQKNNNLLREFANLHGCDVNFNGGLRMASSIGEADDLKQNCEHLKEWGFNALYFDTDQSQHIAIAPLVRGSMFVPGEGIVDPCNLINTMIAASRKSNVWIAYGARVVKAWTNKEYPRVLLSNGHTIYANSIIHTNVNTTDCDLIKEGVTSAREHAIRTSPFSKELDDMPLPLMPIELNYGVDSLRINDQSIIMVGGKSSLRKPDPDVNNLNDSAYNQKILDHLDCVMMRHFPFSNHTEISHCWTYIENTSNDSLPIVGAVPDLMGHYINAAYGRNKFGLAFLASKNLAEIVLAGAVSDTEFSLFNPTRLEG